MLSEPMIQLLTAFVDGEMSQRERKAVMRLLNKSSEARDLLRQLQENAHKLKKLPRHKVEPSLVNEVLHAIAEAQAQPKPAPTPRRRWMPYLAATMAASLLIGVIGILYYQATQGDGPTIDVPVLVENKDKKDGKPEIVPPVTPQKKPNPLLNDLAKMTEGMFRDFGAPVIEERGFSAAFAELKKDGKSAGQFVHELNREKAVVLEITVKRNSEAMTRLLAVLQDQKIKLVADPTAKKVLDDKKAEFLVYAENLTTGDLAMLMSDLSESYVVPGAKNQKNAPSPYQKVTLTPLVEKDMQDVAKLLGVERSALERKDGKPEPKSERVVVLLPSGAGTQSVEMRQFINQRRGTQPSGVQVLIKIRQE